MAEEESLHIQSFSTEEMETLQFSHIESIGEVTSVSEQSLSEEEHIIGSSDSDAPAVLTSLDDTETEHIATEQNSSDAAFKPEEMNSSVGRLQDIRVDNWGNYCLQRLQNMYESEDGCDMLLQFHSGETMRVHRIIMNVCTEYFANLEKITGTDDSGLLLLPDELDYKTTLTIIRFFYTGKLEVRGLQFNEIYRIVKLMDITILTKLLEAHARKPAHMKREVPKIQERVLSKITGQSMYNTRRPMSKKATMGGMSLGGTPGKVLKITTPGSKLPPGVKTKTVLARVQSQPLRSQAAALKRHSMWRDRRTFIQEKDPSHLERWPIKDEPAKPTRFEWPDPEDDNDTTTNFITPVPSVSTTQSVATKRTEKIPVKSAEIFDSVKAQTSGQKRVVSVKQEVNNEDDHSPFKVPKLEEVQTDSTYENHEDHKTNHSIDSMEISNESEQTNSSSTSITSPSTEPSAISSSVTPGSSSLKTSTPGKPKVEKTVRFAPEVGKENKTKPKPTPPTLTIPKETGKSSDTASSHSKIISEVLKKYPDLVRENRNIKLKIVQKGSDGSPVKDVSSSSKSKVSYIVLKSTSSPDSTGSVVLKKAGSASQNVTKSSFWNDESKDENKTSILAENVSGPWICSDCNPETPLHFDSYYTYRRHLVDIHNEKVDSRMCEYCGHKSSKRNLLMYHLYTKHNVTPPSNFVFPSCDRCDYVALSGTLLTKHKLTHTGSKEFVCTICDAAFKTNTALQSHMSANLHKNKQTKVYECPYCRKPFVRNISVKAHIRSTHKDIARPEEMEDPRLPPDASITARASSMAVSKKRTFPAILSNSRSSSSSSSSNSTTTAMTGMVELISNDLSDASQPVSLVAADGSTIELVPGMDTASISVPVTLVPSSEAEALTNVASSIAASIGLEESQETHTETDYASGVDSNAVYIMDPSQAAIEVDMSSVGVAMTQDGQMVLAGGEEGGEDDQLIVQDIHGNQFRRVTGVDESGKPVIFFQLSEPNDQVEMVESTSSLEGVVTSTPVFVSSSMSLPITTESTTDSSAIMSESHHEQQQIIEMVTENEEPTGEHAGIQLITDNGEHNADDGTEMQLATGSEQENSEMRNSEESVEELHIVLDSNDGGNNFVDTDDTRLVISDDSILVHEESNKGESITDNSESTIDVTCVTSS